MELSTEALDSDTTSEEYTMEEIAGDATSRRFTSREAEITAIASELTTVEDTDDVCKAVFYKVLKRY